MGRSNPPIFLPPHLASLGSQFHPPLFPHLKGKYNLNEYKFHFFKRKFPPKQTSNFTRDKIDYFVFLIFVTFRSSINLFWFKKKRKKNERHRYCEESFAITAVSIFSEGWLMPQLENFDSKITFEFEFSLFFFFFFVQIHLAIMQSNSFTLNKCAVLEISGDVDNLWCNF